jgi:hypothetical protein
MDRRRLGGPQSLSGCGEEKNTQPPPGIEPLNSDCPKNTLMSKYHITELFLLQCNQ